MTIEELIDKYQKKITAISKSMESVNQENKHLLISWGARKDCYEDIISDLKKFGKTKNSERWNKIREDLIKWRLHNY